MLADGSAGEWDHDHIRYKSAVANSSSLKTLDNIIKRSCVDAKKDTVVTGEEQVDLKQFETEK